MSRFYMDKPDDFEGFNQLQRGASPARHRRLRVFAAVGGSSRARCIWRPLRYFLNSNPRSEAFGVGKGICSTDPTSSLGPRLRFVVTALTDHHRVEVYSLRRRTHA